MNRRKFLQGIGGLFASVVFGGRRGRRWGSRDRFEVGDRVMIRRGVLDYDFAASDGFRDLVCWTGVVESITLHPGGARVVFDLTTRASWPGAYRRGLVAHGFREDESFWFFAHELCGEEGTDG